MDSALKRDAVVSESVIGTTPGTPAFKVLRTISVGAGPQRPNERSPERVSHGQATNMFQGLFTATKTIEMPWVRDAAADILWQSLFWNTFSTNVLKNGFTPAPFTLEEKYEGGATDPYRRMTGCLVDSATIAFRNDGQPGRVTFNVRGRDEGVATAAISGATYADAAPGLDPVTASEIAATSVFGLTTPGIVGFNLTISNNLRERYAFGSPKPLSHGRGWLDVRGNIEFYFGAAADYSTFTTRQSNLALELTLGSVTDNKDILKLYKCDVWNPAIGDPGPTGDHTVVLEYLAKYSLSDTASLELTRQVPA